MKEEELKQGDLITISNFQWIVPPYNPGELAIVLDVKKRKVKFAPEVIDHDEKFFAGDYDLFVMFINDNKTSWISSSRVKKANESKKIQH